MVSVEDAFIYVGSPRVTATLWKGAEQSIVKLRELSYKKLTADREAGVKER